MKTGGSAMLKLRHALLAAALLLPAALVPVPASAQQKITIGVSLAQDDNPFYIAMLRGIRARAQELGWEVATVSANEDKVKQINGVQDLVARGVKGILISPIDAVGVNAAYDAAKAGRSEEHTSELQSHVNLVCRLLLEKKNTTNTSWGSSAEAKTKNGDMYSSHDGNVYKNSVSGRDSYHNGSRH